jgi:hypothetical protein
VSGCSPIVFVVGAGRPKKSPSLAEGLVFYLKKFVMMADYRTPAPLKIKTFGKKRPQPVGPAAIERAEGQLSTQSRRSLPFAELRGELPIHRHCLDQSPLSHALRLGASKADFLRCR